MAKLTAAEVKDGMEFILINKPNFICYKLGVNRDKNYKFGSSFPDKEEFVVIKKPYKDKSGTRMIDFKTKTDSKEYTTDWYSFRIHTNYKM